MRKIKAKLYGRVGHGRTRVVHPDVTQCPRPEEYFSPGDGSTVGDTKLWTCTCGRQWTATLRWREDQGDDVVAQFIGWTYIDPAS